MNNIDELVTELNTLKLQIDPQPDPSLWPPPGWAYHPTDPNLLYRVIDAETLREEIFGSEQKTEWLRSAKARVLEIQAQLINYFFPKAKEDATQRKSKDGYKVMLKTAVVRKVDMGVLDETVTNCQKILKRLKMKVDLSESLIRWKAELETKEYKKLPDEIRAEFDHALIITDAKPVFEIVKDGGAE